MAEKSGIRYFLTLKAPLYLKKIKPCFTLIHTATFVKVTMKIFKRPSTRASGLDNDTDFSWVLKFTSRKQDGGNNHIHINTSKIWKNHHKIFINPSRDILF